MEQSEIGNFILTNPFFKKHELSTLTNNILDVLFYNGSIDCFCPKCGSDSVFLGENGDSSREQRKANISLSSLSAPGQIKNKQNYSGVYLLDFRCSRIKDHKLHFVLRVDEQKLSKIGQSPSPLEITRGNLKQYKALLDGQFSDLNSAIILYSNNFGIAAFTHLRRLVENFFMKEALNDWTQSNLSSTINYNELRFKEKVGLVKDYLPQTFTDNPALYSIISSGIHGLSEDQCLVYFPPLRDCILLCLEEKLSDIKKQKIKASVKKSLNEINSTIANS